MVWTGTQPRIEGVFSKGECPVSMGQRVAWQRAVPDAYSPSSLVNRRCQSLTLEICHSLCKDAVSSETLLLCPIPTIYATKTGWRKIAFGASRSMKRFARVCLHCPPFMHVPRNADNVGTTEYKGISRKRYAKESVTMSVCLVFLLGLCSLDKGRDLLGRENHLIGLWGIFLRDD